MPTQCQTVAGAAQFTGAAGLGLWTFSPLFDRIPRTTRVVVHAISYTELMAGVALTTDVQVWASRPGGLATERMLIGIGQASESLLNPITGDAELRLCGIVVPRDPGDFGPHWSIHLSTINKTQTATACLDWTLVPYPDTSLRDSGEV